MKSKKGRRRAAGILSIFIIGGLLFGGILIYQTPQIEISCGKYRSTKNDLPMPMLILEENGQFELYISVTNSYFSVGSYTRNGKWLTLATDDGLYRYVFAISRHTLKFNAARSQFRSSLGIADGAVLKQTEG